MKHPTPGDLLELHFGELDGERSEAMATHAHGCPECRALLAGVEWLERGLAVGPGDAPPADGLERVLARIEGSRRLREQRAPGFRAAVPSVAALVAGAVATHLGGAAAALVFFALGSIVTLSLAPVLILESQRRPS